MRFPGLILFIGVTLSTVSCVDIPKYDPTPAIEFVGIDKFDIADNDLKTEYPRVRITFSFEDGDGDLGDDAQSAERLNLLQQNGGWGNYYIRVYRLVNEKWERYPMPELDSSQLIFPILKTDGVRGPIRGKLDFDIDFAKGNGYKLTPLKFEVKIRDRQLRESNIIETDSISVPIFDEF